MTTAPRRGLTLIEVLLSLVIMSALASACSFWIRAASSQFEFVEEYGRHAEIERTMSHIRQAIACGDFLVGEPTPRVTASGDVLRIWSRTPNDGKRELVYTFDGARQTLSLREGIETSLGSRRIVLSGVSAFDAEVIQWDDRDAALRVQIKLADFAEVEQLMVFP